MNGTTSDTTYSSNGMYSTPQLIDVIVNQENIELIYKRQLMVSTGWGMPSPEVYKVVYSRIDGSEKTIFGEYVAPTKESYKF